MAHAVGDEYRPGVERVHGAALQAGGGGSGLLGDERPGGIVPGLEIILHIAVRPAAGHPAQVQLRAAQAADVGAALEDALDHVEHPVRLLPLIGGGAHDDQGLFHLAHVADVDGLAVEIGPLAQFGRKGLVPEGVIAAAEH